MQLFYIYKQGNSNVYLLLQQRFFINIGGKAIATVRFSLPTVINRGIAIYEFHCMKKWNAKIHSIAGALSDMAGDYKGAFYLAGASLALSGIICFPLRCISRREGNQQVPVQHVIIIEGSDVKSDSELSVRL